MARVLRLMMQWRASRLMAAMPADMQAPFTPYARCPPPATTLPRRDTLLLMPLLLMPCHADARATL
jgi:hypothetical protein